MLTPPQVWASGSQVLGSTRKQLRAMGGKHGYWWLVQDGGQQGRDFCRDRHKSWEITEGVRGTPKMGVL